MSQPEKEMATHSSTLAWKIPWTEEPGRLQSMGLQRVKKNQKNEPALLRAFQGDEGSTCQGLEAVKSP